MGPKIFHWLESRILTLGFQWAVGSNPPWSGLTLLSRDANLPYIEIIKIEGIRPCVLYCWL